MTAPGRPNGSGESARLRDDIDRGLTGDKVAAFDPAAAPLGTDEEAAGTPPPRAATAAARARERRRPPGDPQLTNRMVAKGAGTRRVAMVVAVLALALALAWATSA